LESDNTLTIAVSGLRLPSQVVTHVGDTVLRLLHKLLDPAKLPDWVDEVFAAEVYYAFYVPLPSVKPKDDMDPAQFAVLSAMLDDATFWRAKPFTSVDRVSSAVAAASFLDRLIRMLAENAGGASREPPGGSRDSVRNAVRRALRSALSDASVAKKVETMVYSALPGSTSELAFEDVMEKILVMARRSDVSRILSRLSGVKLPARKSSRQERFTRGWIDGLEIGADIERVHYTSLALPDDVFYALLAESRLLLYRRVIDTSHGPVYVLLDKSGSMSGEKIDWARAVAVALMIRSLRDRRSFYARFFDAQPHDLITVRSTPRPRDLLDALDRLSRVKAGGGTDITRALVTATEDLARGRVSKRSDIVLITDGEDSLSPHVLTELLGVVRARLHTVMIGGDNEVLRQVSASYMVAEALSEEEIIRVVDFVSFQGGSTP